MSNISSYYTYTPDDFNAQFDAKRKLASKVAWYNPVEDAIYVSDNDKSPTFPDGMKVIPRVANIAKAKELEKAGKMNSDEARFNIYNTKDGWDNLANDYFDAIKGRTAGVMTPNDFSAIEVTNVLSTLLGLPERNFVLQNAATTIRTPYLDVIVDTCSGFDVA